LVYSLKTIKTKEKCTQYVQRMEGFTISKLSSNLNVELPTNIERQKKRWEVGAGAGGIAQWYSAGLWAR
jgi:DNA mismatch repair protein MutH